MSFPTLSLPKLGREQNKHVELLPRLGERISGRVKTRVARRIFCRAESSPKGERARNVSSSAVSDKNPKDFVTNVRSVESRIIRKRSRRQRSVVWTAASEKKIQDACVQHLTHFTFCAERRTGKMLISGSVYSRNYV